MLDNKTKARIAQEANDKAVEYANAGVYHTVLPKGHLMYPSATGHFSDYFKAYIAGAEAEATRAAGLISALITAKKALAGSYDVQNHPGDGSSDCDAAIKEIDEALTNYNNPK